MLKFDVFIKIEIFWSKISEQWHNRKEVSNRWIIEDTNTLRSQCYLKFTNKKVLTKTSIFAKILSTILDIVKSEVHIISIIDSVFYYRNTNMNPNYI